jgi:glutamate dehydrogenase (NAD(P)+)
MKPVSLEQEINPWEAQSARFDVAAQKLNLDEGLVKVLRYPSRELIVHIPVSMDNGKIEVFTGFRVQHSIAALPKVESVTALMSRWTKSVRSPLG